MAQYNLASSRRTKDLLRNLLLDGDSLGGNEVLNLYRIIANDDEPVKALLERCPENRHFREALLTNPDEMLPKLSHLLRSIGLNILSRNPQSAKAWGMPGTITANKAIHIPAAFTNHVILSLANEAAGVFDINSNGYHDFTLSVLKLYIPLAQMATSSPKDLRNLFSKILEMPDEVCILEKVVSDEAGAHLLTNLLENKSLSGQVFTESNLRLLGSRLAKLITSCIASHGAEIEDAVFLWEQMEGVSKCLEEQIREIGARGNAINAGGARISLSKDEEDLLNSARVIIPYNATTARSAIQGLLENYKDQINTMLSSFPCSTCKARLSGTIKACDNDTYVPGHKVGFENINVPLGVFPVYLSDNAMRDLKFSRVDGTLSNILATLRKLADGLWESESDLSISVGKSRTRREPILRAARWCPRGYILWEMGVGRVNENAEKWTQIVKIIRIGFGDDMKAAALAARKCQQIYTKKYRNATAISIQNPARPGTLIPKIFAGEDAVGLEGSNITLSESSSESKRLSPSDALILHKLFCTGKQYSLTKRVAEMILQGGYQAEVPFIVSAEEEHIINYIDSSICILGRSGTGKTTCLVYRLLTNYIQDRLTIDNKETRQVFLTRSPVLAGKIRQYVTRLINSHCMRFATEYNSTGAEISDLDPDISEDNDSPDLLDIDDKNWPVICTFDSFAAMLERSLRFAQRNVFLSDPEMSSIEYANRQVDFGKFRRSYWPSFRASTKKGLSVDVVFSEILGVIKATSSASQHRPLSEMEYQELSRRIAPNFRQGSEREAVYSLYKAYEKRKSSLNEWDDLDRAARLQRLMLQDPKLSSRLRSQITEIFVDEIQDQRLPEIEMLLDFVNDAKSFAFAGDTAQCISRDSCFRFQDLKKLFFQKYERQGILAGQQDLAKLNLFTLSKNYRTHNGILKLAAKVIDILSESFPYLIDKFSPELGNFDGPLPIVFSGFSSDIFVPRETENSTSISEFGADQVFITRDEETKLLLSKEMGDKVMILTILESKGMEFQDVFLFDFFSDSTCQAAFRALVRAEITGTRLDDKKYPELCAELKNLYVAITRSREMLYIVESSTEAVKPVQDMWGLSKNPIVHIVSPDDQTLRTRLDEIRPGQSSPQAWAQKGEEFFSQLMFEQAMRCYRKAGESKLEELCQACIEERNGRDIISDPNCWEEARAHYLKGAELFKKCEKYNRALGCFESIKEFLMAGELCEKLSKISDTGRKLQENYARRAAKFFMAANEIRRAIQLYKRLGHHESVTSAYRKINDIDELIIYLKEHRGKIDQKIHTFNSRIIALTVFTSEYRNNDLRKQAISLLDEQEQEELYRQFNFYMELRKLLISQGRLEEAIELSYSQGHWKDIGELLREAESKPNFPGAIIINKGEEYAARASFHELSVCLPAIVRGDKNWLLSGTEEQPIGSSDGPSDALKLADLLVLQLYASGGDLSSPKLQLNRAIVNSLIFRCSELLLNLHRSRTMSKIQLLFLQVIRIEYSDKYQVFQNSIIYDGDGYGNQEITGDEPHLAAITCSMCSYRECRYGEHKRPIQKEEMILRLEFAWSMSLLTSYCAYVNRSLARGRGSFRDIRQEGRRWYKRVFENVIVVSDLLECPSARLFLIEKKAKAIGMLKNDDVEIQKKGRAELGCLDDLEWRVGALIRKSDNEFWNLLDAWERIAALNPRRYVKDEWWNHVRNMGRFGKSTMHLLNKVEGCLRDTSKTVEALRAFAQNFRANLLQFVKFDEMHLLLNRLDRVIAIALYISSRGEFILKKSQLEFLQENGASHQNPEKEHATAAEEILNNVVDVYNFFLDKVSATSIPKPVWYKEAMRRRIEESSIIALLNSRNPYSIIGRFRFIQGFLQQAKRMDFWMKRQGRPNPQAVASIPTDPGIFLNWILGNIDVLQSQADPIVLCRVSQRPEESNRFRGFPIPIIPFQITNISSKPTGTDAAEPDIYSSLSSTDVEAARRIQRNWRICSRILRDKRYKEQNPGHRRITQILQEPCMSTKLDEVVSRKRFRIIVFELLRLVGEMRFQLSKMANKMEILGKRKNSMEVIEKILARHDFLRDLSEQVTTLEKSIEPSALAKVEGGSIVEEVLEITKSGRGLLEKIISTISGVDNWT
ncbi:uncharacterized protein DFL_003123 [Arthrobotrys flagrans]|uniref:UvrD-like helicase ATP-binding domain-containing protein n=1 Tax=Arthrobotrys flagrans TaxID=97331 RepID=A0A437ADT3_ARTFL|nr:hypothetical protein DFL_003123 [Arthrobotrys flagrans]